MPTPRATTVEDVLKKSPILIDGSTLAAAFPTAEEKLALLTLSQQIHDAVKANEDVEKTWQTIAGAKAIAIRLLSLALV